MGSTFITNLDGCGQCMKWSLFIINIITFIGGLTLAGLGIWTCIDKSFANELLGTNLYEGVVYIMIGTGILIFVISCFGCFGAVREIRSMLVMYFIAVFMIFVTMFIGGIIAYVFRTKVEVTLLNGMQSSLRIYGSYGPVTDAWDETQSRLYCCGVTGPDDWRGHIPDSCCREPVPGKRQRCNLLVEHQNAFTLFQRGCYNVTAEYVKEHAAVIGGAGIILSCIMLLALFFSCSLYRRIDPL